MRDRDLKSTDRSRWGHSGGTPVEFSPRGYLKRCEYCGEGFIGIRAVRVVLAKARPTDSPSRRRCGFDAGNEARASCPM